MRAASDKNFKYIFNTGIDEYMKCKLYIKWHSLLILYFCRVIRIFGFNKTDSPGYDTTGRLTRRGMIPGPGEIDSAGYDALGSNVMADLLLTRRVMSL